MASPPELRDDVTVLCNVTRFRYPVNMGRPKEHNEQTAIALLDAAERTVEAEGIEALSVRGVADAIGTTTRAVYSLFGSKDGLVDALGARAFELLGAAIAELPVTDDPAADLVEAGVVVFRRFALAHPVLFQIGVQRTLAAPALATRFGPARTEAFEGLQARFTRLDSGGMLGRRDPRHAACEFHALCEGLAALELRGGLPPGEEESVWRDAFTALLTGFAAPTRDSHRRRKTR
jgi:AcrR family transcriptional regulator